MTETNAIVESEHVPEVPKFSERIIQWFDEEGFECAEIYEDEGSDGVSVRHRIIRVLPDKPVERRVEIDWAAVAKDCGLCAFDHSLSVSVRKAVERHARIVEVPK